MIDLFDLKTTFIKFFEIKKIRIIIKKNILFSNIYKRFNYIYFKN